MATTSFDTTFRINPDWGVKKSPSIAPVLKPTDEVMEKIEKLKRK